MLEDDEVLLQGESDPDGDGVVPSVVWVPRLLTEVFVEADDDDEAFDTFD